ESLTVIPIEEPYGPLAVQIAENYVRRKLKVETYTKSKTKGDTVCTALYEESRQFAIRALQEKALETLRQSATLPDSASLTFRSICLYQPHICKKDIMFTNLVFSLALGHFNDVDYVWTSDSDTWVYSDTLYQT